MAVAHKDLTGTDLHEIKGASSATSGQVPIADGAGTAPFGKLTHSSLQTTGNPFGAQLLHVREEQSSGVSSTTPTVAAWNIQTLNTVKTNEITSASLSSNTITLPAGTYYVEARSVNYSIGVSPSSYGRAKARLQNTTAGTTLIAGETLGFLNGNSTAPMYFSMPPCHVVGRFTLAGTTNIQFQCYINSANSATTGVSSGINEVYAEVCIWKVA